MQSKTPRHPSTTLVLGSTLCVTAALILLVVTQIWMFPRVTRIDVDLRGYGDPMDGIFRAIGESTTHAKFDMHIQNAGVIPVPAWYSVLHIGVIDTVTLNGESFPHTENYSWGKLGPFFVPGENILHGEMHLKEALPLFEFALRASIWNPLTILLLLLHCVIVYAWLKVLRRGPWLQDSWVWRLTVTGVLLRTYYQFTTPYYSRAYDYHGHIDNIAYFAHHGWMPQTGTLWEAYQMPLYYAMQTPVYLLGEALGLSYHEIPSLLQIPSLIISILTLLAGIRILQRLLADDRAALRIGVMLFATFPWFIYLSSLISNDVLLTFFGVVWCGALLEAVDHPADVKRWIWVGVCSGLGILAKATAVPWVAISALAVFLTPKPASLKIRVRAIVIVAVVAFLMGGSVYVYRHMTEPRFALVANAFQQWGAPPIPLSVQTILSFNPLRLLRLPFRSFASQGELEHVFFEDIVRTGHFGSVILSDEAALLHLLLLGPLVCAAMGMVQELRKRRLTLAIILLGAFGAGILMRLKYPFPPSQHFRYVTIILLPMVLLAARGSSVPKSMLGRVLGHVTIGVYAGVCALTVFNIGLST